jgi:hypothetical protein
MEKLNRANLWSLEQYASERTSFRARVIAHKKNRQVFLHPNATLYFEDFLTMKYQVQEMLRVERIFEPAAIAEEIEAYNPLIPDGSNWKATFMIEYPEEAERRTALARMTGIEHHVWITAGDRPRRIAVANEDLDRSTDEKTAAVHFLRFELEAEDIAALRAGASLAMGINHPQLECAVTVTDPVRAALLADFD